MQLNRKTKRYIQNNYKNLELDDLAKKTGVSPNQVKAYMKKKGFHSKNTQKSRALTRQMFNNWQDVKSYLYDNRGIFIVIASVAVLVYFNAMWGEFVSDDLRGYQNNLAIRDFWASIQTLQFQNVLYATMYKLFGQTPIPLHVFSLSLHILTACAAFVFVSLAFDKRVATIAALLFVVHPINTETVDWISAWKYLLIGFITFTMLSTYITYRDTENKKLIIALAFGYLVVLLYFRFPWLYLIPPLIFVVDYFFINKFKFNKKESYLPYIYISIPVLIYGLLIFRDLFSIRVESLQGTYEVNAARGATYTTRVPYTIYMTTKLLLFPKDLSLYHEGEIITKSIFAIMVMVSLLVLGILLYFLRKDKKVAGLLIFMIVSISPTISPIQVAWFVAERYMYIASLAFTIIVAKLFIYLEKKYKIPNLTVYLFVILMTIYSVRSFLRNIEWQTRKQVWESTARVSPNSPRVYNNLGDVYGLEGDYERSIRAFQTALILDPNYGEAMHNLGNTYILVGDLEKAKEVFTRSLEINPTIFQSVYKLGVVAYAQQDYAKAKEYFEETIKMNPNFAPSYEGLKLVEQQSNIEK